MKQCTMSYSAEESSPIEYLESCCICDEEFSSDSELSYHLLDHANDEEFKINLEELEKKNSASADSGAPKTNFGAQQNLKRSFTQRSKSPEVWEIISDDSDDESTKNKKAAKVSNSFRLVTPTAVQPNGSGQPKNGATPSNPASSNNAVSNNNAIGQTGPPYNCHQCKEVFKDVKLFKEHLLVHEKPKPYTCQICNKKFAYKGTLRQHLHLHIGEKSHECKTCHKKFSMKRMLRQHEETHEMQVDDGQTANPKRV